MLPAIGASLALDAIQSLTSQASSQAVGSGGFDLGGSSDVSPPAKGTVPGFSSAQISSDNFNALLNAQNSGDLGSAFGFGGSPSDPSQGQFMSASGTASSAYDTVNQLVQSTAVPLGFSSVSISA